MTGERHPPLEERSLSAWRRETLSFPQPVGRTGSGTHLRDPHRSPWSHSCLVLELGDRFHPPTKSSSIFNRPTVYMIASGRLPIRDGGREGGQRMASEL